MVSPEILYRYAFFRDLDNIQVENLANIASEESFSSGVTLISESEQAEYFYFLLEGAVVLYCLGSDKTTINFPKGIPVGEINPGEPFYISAFLESHTFSSIAHFIKPSRVIRFDIDMLNALMKKDQRLAYILVQQVAAKLVDQLHTACLQLAVMEPGGRSSKTRENMIIVSKILDAKGEQVWTIQPKATVFEALKLMADKGIGALVVVENGKVVGIFSERDYARKVILEGRSSKEIRVERIMTKHVITINPETTVDVCMDLMTDRRIRHLPVIKDNRLIGVISIGDVVKAMISEQEYLIEHLENYIIGRA